MPAGENGRSGATPLSKELADALARSKAPKIHEGSELAKSDLSPMLAETADAPFEGADWIFELKIDGYRALLDKEGDHARILYRRGREATAIYPDLIEQLSALPVSRALLDGEIAVVDSHGHPDFGGLQQRSGLTNPLDISAVLGEYPVTYFAFDLLALEGRDLRGLPLLERKNILKLLLAEPRQEPPGAQIRYLDHVAGTLGKRLYSRAEALGLEGVMGKRPKSTYRSLRSSDWKKIRVQRTADFAIAGVSAGSGSRTELGALQLAAWDGKQYVYAGSAGSGLRPDEIAPLAERLLAHPLEAPPCVGTPKAKHIRWCEPRLVCEVRYLVVTSDGLLRQPVFLRMRPDKDPKECPPVAPRSENPEGEMARKSSVSRFAQMRKGQKKITSSKITSEKVTSAGAGDVWQPAADRLKLIELPASALEETKARQKFTNPGKLLWPDDGISKSDLIGYYRAIAPYILPHLRDRPATLTRYPDGINGKSFFQKHAASYTPDWVRVATPETREHIEAIVCDNLDTLLYVANLANIPLHIPSERIADPGRPDHVTIDLDPKSAPFEHVIRVALELRESCEKLGLACFIKTSGQSGLHVMLPLGGVCSHEQAGQLAELLARWVETRIPKLCTMERMIEKRQGRVYLDIGQNGASRTVAAAYSVRPVPGARASAPLLWDEVNDKLDPAAFTLKTLPARALKLGADPLLNVLTIKPDLPRALARLSELSTA